MSVPVAEVEKLFSSLAEDASVAILVQPNPDPDCLGAAAAFGLLLQKQFGLKSKTFYLGEVSHPQNKSMINVLNLKLTKGELFSLEDFAATVVLDTDLINTGFATDNFKSANIRIDHHSMDRDNGGSIEDIRLVGSTCSMVWEWLKAWNVSLESHADIATAMVLGIKTDTGDFSSDNTCDLDFEAFRDLIPHVDRDRLGRLSVYPLPKSLFEHEASALASKKVRNSVLVSSVGSLVSQKRDEIPIIADRFVRMDGISTAVVLGVIDNNLIASVRSTDSRVSVINLCADVFGEDYSGAKAGCGGARVPLESMTPVAGMEFSEEAKELVYAELFRHYSECIFAALGEE